MQERCRGREPAGNPRERGLTARGLQNVSPIYPGSAAMDSLVGAD